VLFVIFYDNKNKKEKTDMPAGRPPKPIEQKRKTGRTPSTDSGGRKLPEIATVTVLPMATSVPEPPTDLGLEGRDLWEKTWNTAITWLSPISDMKQVESACRLADDVALARQVYRTTRDVADGKLLVSFSDALQKSLTVLGFNPVSRSQLGVAEVRRATALEELIRQKESR
jgi:phage terminase small subunit